ncbi:hypothetical protein C0993_001277 [Termitomyces sp. T159_Od127]|nr:hypothetical protein C0993_001277 [Termitomyces sp. T159_Od127]
MANSAPRPQPRPRRIGDALDAIKQEFDVLAADRDALRAQRDDLENQVNLQLTEVTNIRRSLYDLELRQDKVRQHYEDELRRLRLELSSARQQGIPGFDPKARDADRIQDTREPKRPKPERGTSASCSTSFAHTRTDASPGDPLPSLYPTRSSYQLPPINTAAAAAAASGFPDDLNVPPEFRKEGSDWFAVFNPRVKRSLDISLLHTLVHARHAAPWSPLSVTHSLLASFAVYNSRSTASAKICVLAEDTAGKSGDLYIRSVRFSPDGKLLATGAEDRQIRIWDIAKKRIRTVFSGHTQEIYSLDFSLDGRFIISGSGDKTARVWDMHDEEASKVLTINDTDSLNNDAGVTSVAISPNGQLVAAGSLDTIVRIWDVASGVLVERLRGHKDSVYSVAFTPDGRGLVSGSLDKTLKYWDVAPLVARKEEVLLKKPAEKAPSACTMDYIGHKDYVLSVSVSHDGQWVVSGSKDRCVQFWDIRNSALQFVLQGHKNSVISLDVNPVGNMLATGSGDSLARIWRYNTIP